MDKKTMFNEALAKLVSYATAHDNLITMEDVKSFFNGLIDDDSQYKLIYDYLSINKIEIKGFTPSDDNIFDDSHGMNAISENIAKDENGQSQEETDFIKMYMDDMDALYPQYGFARHKGYGTAAHYAALREYGPSPIHRPTYLRKMH